MLSSQNRNSSSLAGRRGVGFAPIVVVAKQTAAATADIHWINRVGTFLASHRSFLRRPTASLSYGRSSNRDKDIAGTAVAKRQSSRVSDKVSVLTAIAEGLMDSTSARQTTPDEAPQALDV